MLQFMRRVVSSWVGAGILLLALLAMVVTLYEARAPGSGDGAGGVTVLARVGDRSVTEPQYVRMVDRAVARERERNPQMTLPQFLRLGGGEAVLSQMIQGEAVSVFAKEQGMVISDRMIDGEIASIPAMQVNGRFDEATYRRLLAEQRIGEAELRESIATDLRRRQLLLPVGLGAVVPRTLAEPFAALLLETRRGEILAVPAAAMPDPGKPTDAQLASFHAANRAAYTIPERRGFRYAILDPSAFAARAQPSDAEIEAYYRKHAADYGGVETREVKQVILRDEAAARALVAEIRGGAGFEAAAARRGWSATDVRLGEVTEEAMARESGKAAAAAAFALAAGKVGGPVKSPLGFHVLAVTRIVPPRPMPLADVRGEIARKLSEQKLHDLVADAAARAEDQLADGKPLGDVARELDLKLETVAPTTADGRQFGADYKVTRFDQPLLLQQVFAASADDGPQFADLGDSRSALFEITDTLRPQPVPLSAIRADVAAAWVQRARADQARALAERIAAAAGRQPLGAAAAAHRLPPPQALAIRRLELTQMAQQGKQIPPPVVRMLSTPAGAARTVAAPDGQGWFVVAVTAVEPGNVAEMPQLTGAVLQGMQRAAGDETVASLLQAVEREAGVVRRPEAIRAVNQRLGGIGAP